MTKFIVIEENSKNSFAKKMIEYVDEGYEIINCMHSGATRKHHGYLIKR